MITLDALLTAMVTGIFMGASTTLGTYLVTKALIKNLEKLEARLKNGRDDKERKGS